MTDHGESITQAESTAIEILRKYKIERTPIDVERIASMEGIQVLYRDMENDVSGFAAKKNGNRYIAINETHPKTRQRFTLAHELGHHLLHLSTGKSGDLFVDRAVLFRNTESSEGTRIEEITANAFAAALLMPENILRKSLNDLGNCISDVDLVRLTNEFQVSEHAMQIRLAKLDLLV